MAPIRSVIVAAAGVYAASGTGVTMGSHAKGNPIRKVVTMLQNIQKKVEGEGKEAEDLYEKFECECNAAQTALAKQIESAEAKSSDVAAAAEAGAKQVDQLKADITQAKKDRASAKEAISSATELRAKEADAYKAAAGESAANIESMGKAISAIKSGGSAFLQTDASKKLKDLVQASDSTDKDDIMAFLQGGDASEGTGEIVGMLTTMKEEMEKDAAAAEGVEKDAIATFKDLVKAKNKEFNTLQAAIEEKMARLGELGVANAEASNDGGDTADQLAEDKKLLADSKAACAAREKAYEAEKKTRSEEVLALADTIKMLNSDDALELMKKALPSAASSLLQVPVTEKEVRAKALLAIKEVQKKHKSTKLDFVMLALQGKRKGFDKVTALIDKFIAALKAEQQADDDKKAYCQKEFDKADDEKKVFERKVADAETGIKDAKESVKTLQADIEATKAAIADLDTEVAIATAQRQKENAAFKALKTQNAAASQLLTMAKARLDKFYNPSFVQIQAHDQSAETTSVESKGNAVIAMLATIIADLEKEVAVASTEEKNSQGDYEKAMADAKETRIADSKGLEDKSAAFADAEENVQKAEGAKADAQGELQGANDYIMTLRADCDWLINYYDTRKQARADEMDALGKAKDVLNGADFSFLQVAQKRAFLGVN